jgi:SAM-dependent methyltransferase
MKDFDELTYGERIAEFYDRFYPAVDESALDLLEELARGGQVLELGIGTGRIALPLHQRGVRIKGIDASPAMIEKLLAKPGGSEIEVVQGSFMDLPIEGQFSLIFIAFNTLYALLTQADQIHCLRNVAAHLSENGLFLVEAFVPDLTRFARGQNVSVVDMDEGQVRIDVSQHDPVRQQVTSQHLLITEDGVRMFPVTLRYIWPSELDLMAHIAGLQLKHRWGGWEKEPFEAGSGRHISVYARSA